MINMFTKLENIQNVTESENKVVQYILTHPDSVMTMSIKEPNTISSFKFTQRKLRTNTPINVRFI